jgi:hypothetical protein
MALIEFNADLAALGRIASALERLADVAERAVPPIDEIRIPDKPFGREAISYLDEEELWTIEQREKMGVQSESDLP